MADPNRPLGGFANQNFVLINGEYWSASGNRRYVQAHAWIAEFANILLDWMRIAGHENPIWNGRRLLEQGPLEIIKYIEYNSNYIACADPNDQIRLQPEMYYIRRLRNQITHENIENADTLKKLLDRMKKVCK